LMLKTAANTLSDMLAADRQNSKTRIQLAP
jgi:hypothetical protein